MSDEEYKSRVKALMVKLIPKGTADASETEELYLLYNYRMTPRENNKSCGACRSRVYQKMLKYYESIKGE